MLKGIPKILSPELLKILCEMGHSDEIVIADANFPAASHANRLIRMDGHNAPDVLDAILQVFPLDAYVDCPVAFMAEPDPKPVIWKEYKRIIKANDGDPAAIEEVERFAFYDRTKLAYAVIATSESSLKANIILKKGVIKPKA